MKSDTAIARQFTKHRGASQRGLSKQYENTKSCWSFYAGDSMSYKDTIQYLLPKGKRQKALVQFNKVMPYVDAVSGFMAQNRRKAKYLARVDSDQKQQLYSKYMNALSQYVRENANADQLESEQDTDMLVNGYGGMETDISYIIGNATRMPGGEIILKKLDPNTLGWDPSAKLKNLADSRWAFYHEEYEIDDALALFSGSTEEDFQTETQDQTDDDREYYYNPWGGKYDKVKIDDAVDWTNDDRKMVRVYNYQWFEYESFYRCKNPMYSLPPQIAQPILMELQQIAEESASEYPDAFDFDPTKQELTFDSKVKSKLMAAFGDYIEPVEFKRKAYYTAVISGTHVFTKFRSVSQQDFSIQFKTGTYDSINKMWIGMVNSMREPQLYYNKTLTELMFTIASNSKGGVMVEKSAVTDIQKFEEKYAKTDAVIEVEDGAISGNRIMPKGTQKPDSGLENLLQLTDSSIAAASGIDKAFLGTTNAQETGVLYKRRIAQAISQMAKYFDSISLFQKMNARIMLDFMNVFAQNNNGEEFEVLDQGKYQTAQIAEDKFLPNYGVVIQEAAMSPDDKRETAELVSTMGDKFLAAQDATTAKALYMVAVKNLELDSEDMAAITQALQGGQIDPQQYQQLQQQVQLLSSATNQADVDQKKSAAQLNMAKVAQVEADTKSKGINDVKTLEDAHKTGVEASVLKRKAHLDTHAAIVNTSNALHGQKMDKHNAIMNVHSALQSEQGQKHQQDMDKHQAIMGVASSAHQQNMDRDNFKLNAKKQEQPNV